MSVTHSAGGAGVTPKVYFYSNSADTPPGCGVNEEGMPVGCDYLAGETNCVRSLSNFCIRVAAVRGRGTPDELARWLPGGRIHGFPESGFPEGRCGGASSHVTQHARVSRRRWPSRTYDRGRVVSSHLIVIVIIVVSRALAVNAVHIDGGH